MHVLASSEQRCYGSRGVFMEKVLRVNENYRKIRKLFLGLSYFLNLKPNRGRLDPEVKFINTSLRFD